MCTKFAEEPKCVKFAFPHVVVEIRKRPKTLKCDKHTLYYSSEDYKKFRQEYRSYLMYKASQKKSEMVKSSEIMSHVSYFNEDDSFVLSIIQDAYYNASNYASNYTEIFQKTLSRIANDLESTIDLSLISNDDDLHDLFYLY